MPSALSTILLLALLASFVLASPTPRAIEKRSFKVPRYPNPNFKGYDGPKELFKAYSKFQLDVPDALMAAMAARLGGGAAAAAAAGIPGIPAIPGVPGAKAAGPTTTPARAAAATPTRRPTATASPKPAAGAGAGAAIGAGAGAAAGNTTAAPVAAINGTGLVTATPEPNDVEYISPIQIGGQTINMDFDSGSSDLWVFNTQLAPASRSNHTLYDPRKSTTFKMIAGATWSISYGDGSGASGNVGTDTVNIGGAVVENQAIEMATAVSASFVQDTASNGLVGLAFSKLNTVKPAQQKTFFDNVLPSLPEKVFTADLRANAVGAYEFGRIDNSKFTGSLTYAPVITTNGFWEFKTSFFQVGTGAAVQATSGANAIADTGTTLMLVSNEIASAYYSQVQGAKNDATVGGITFPCASALPDLKLDIGGAYMANIPGKFIKFAKVDAAGTTCFGGLQPTTNKLQIWGDILFKAQFVVFNGGNNTIGMAPHV